MAGISEVLVPYSNVEDRKKLEDHIFMMTGRRVSLGPLGYGGDLTLQTLGIDLSRIGRTNITCKRFFPGLHFQNVDEFISWHRRISDMAYPEACDACRKDSDVAALYYDEKKDDISFVVIDTADEWTANRYLRSSDNKISTFKEGYYDYILCRAGNNSNMIMYAGPGHGSRGNIIIAYDESLGSFRKLTGHKGDDGSKELGKGG